MTRNVGPEDRIVRIVAAIAVVALIYVRAIEGTGAVIGAILAAYLLVSAIVTRCLFYKLAGVDTSVQEQPYSTTDDRSGL